MSSSSVRIQQDAELMGVVLISSCSSKGWGGSVLSTNYGSTGQSGLGGSLTAVKTLGLLCVVYSV